MLYVLCKSQFLINDIISASVVRFRLVKVDVAKLLPRGNLDSSYRNYKNVVAFPTWSTLQTVAS